MLFLQSLYVLCCYVKCCLSVCVCVPFVIYVFSYTNVKLHDKQLVSTQLH